MWAKRRSLPCAGVRVFKGGYKDGGTVNYGSHDGRGAPQGSSKFTPPPLPSNEAWESEQDEIERSFSGNISESIQEALEHKQTEMIEAAKVRNMIDASLADRADQFVAEIHHETQELYEAKKKGRKL
jgi:hypothetical protein